MLRGLLYSFTQVSGVRDLKTSFLTLDIGLMDDLITQTGRQFSFFLTRVEQKDYA